MIILDGKAVAQTINQSLVNKITLLKTEYNCIPGLAVIIVGDNKDSLTYVRMKKNVAEKLGIKSQVVHFQDNYQEIDILNQIDILNNDPSIHGILIQLPLPDFLDTEKILASVDIKKDVDGFNYRNFGLLALNQNPSFVPCTPEGVIELLDYYNISVEGLHVVILGKSRIVGLPLSLLFLHRNATVTICDNKTKNEEEITRKADILVSACRQMEMVKGDWIKEGCIIIDIGINHKKDDSQPKGYKIVGDVDFESVKDKVKAITPVPGGVGPLTIAMLMKHTVESAINHTQPSSRAQ